MKSLYHLVDRSIYEKAAETGFFSPDSVVREGYIHCSYAEQVCRIANWLYKDETDLILLEIDRDRTGCKVVDEDLCEMNELFPHIYGKLPNSAVIARHEFKAGPDGIFRLPDSVGVSC